MTTSAKQRARDGDFSGHEERPLLRADPQHGARRFPRSRIRSRRGRLRGTGRRRNAERLPAWPRPIAPSRGGADGGPFCSARTSSPSQSRQVPCEREYATVCPFFRNAPSCVSKKITWSVSCRCAVAVYPMAARAGRGRPPERASGASRSIDVSCRGRRSTRPSERPPSDPGPSRTSSRWTGRRPRVVRSQPLIAARSSSVPVGTSSTSSSGQRRAAFPAPTRTSSRLESATCRSPSTTRLTNLVWLRRNISSRGFSPISSSTVSRASETGHAAGAGSSGMTTSSSSRRCTALRCGATDFTVMTGGAFPLPAPAGIPGREQGAVRGVQVHIQDDLRSAFEKRVASELREGADPVSRARPGDEELGFDLRAHGATEGGFGVTDARYPRLRWIRHHRSWISASTRGGSSQTRMPARDGRVIHVHTDEAALLALDTPSADAGGDDPAEVRLVSHEQQPPERAALREDLFQLRRSEPGRKPLIHDQLLRQPQFPCHDLRRLPGPHQRAGEDRSSTGRRRAMAAASFSIRAAPSLLRGRSASLPFQPSAAPASPCRRK